MRKLSLSFVALAVLTLVPASQAQQFAPARAANIQAKAQKNMAHKSMGNKHMANKNMSKMHAPAKALARYQAWQKSVAFKASQSKAHAKNVKNTKSMKNVKNVQGKVNGVNGSKSKAKNVSMKAQFSKRYKIKQAVKAAIKQRQNAKLLGKAAMAHKQR